jgi:hypothetical protein
MKKIVAPVGAVFGRWTVLGESDRSTKWLVQCSCGSDPKLVDHRTLRSGISTSCGCYRDETRGDNNRTHGQSQTALYKIWAGMIQRCTNPNVLAYPDYGGRGITVCEKWQQFEGFAADMAPRPHGATLERIDNDKGYYLDNCQWASRKAQARNRRSSRVLTFNGQSLTVTEWAEQLGVKSSLIFVRLDRGWSVERALSTPAFGISAP